MCSKQMMGKNILTALLQSDASHTSATGFAGGVNVFVNPEFSSKPWQPSTVEMKRVISDDDGTESSHVVFYFETNRPQGMASFRHVSTACSQRLLPGHCRNMTAVGGFGTWSIPRTELLSVLGPNISLPSLPP
jgi:hypothetical protein